MDINKIEDIFRCPYLYNKQQQKEARLEAIELLKDAKAVIEQAVDLMDHNQVGQWFGVRTWLERIAPQ